MASLRDATGAELVGRPVAWSSSNRLVATVDSGGRVSAAAGTATIIARSSAASGSATLTVVSTPPNVEVTVAYLAQVVQWSDGSVPLIAGGNPRCSG